MQPNYAKQSKGKYTNNVLHCIDISHYSTAHTGCLRLQSEKSAKKTNRKKAGMSSFRYWASDGCCCCLKKNQRIIFLETCIYHKCRQNNTKSGDSINTYLLTYLQFGTSQMPASLSPRRSWRQQSCTRARSMYVHTLDQCCWTSNTTWAVVDTRSQCGKWSAG